MSGYVSQPAFMLETRARQLCYDLGLPADAPMMARDEFDTERIVPQWLIVAEQLRRHLVMTEMVREMGR